VRFDRLSANGDTRGVRFDRLSANGDTRGVRFDRRREKQGKGRTSMLPVYQPALFPVPSSSRRQTPFVLSPSKDERGER